MAVSNLSRRSDRGAPRFEQELRRSRQAKRFRVRMLAAAESPCERWCDERLRALRQSGRGSLHCQSTDSPIMADGKSRAVPEWET